MRDVLLLSAVILYFVSGYFLMKKIDRFLGENEKRKNGEFDIDGEPDKEKDSAIRFRRNFLIRMEGKKWIQ